MAARTPSITAAQINAMREAIKAAGKSSEIIVYPDAPHAFNADYRPSYRPAEAKDGWARMLAWFKKYGVRGVDKQSFFKPVVENKPA